MIEKILKLILKRYDSRGKVFLKSNIAGNLYNAHRSINHTCPKSGYLSDLSILADFQGFDLFFELNKQFSEWNTKGKKK